MPQSDWEKQVHRNAAIATIMDGAAINLAADTTPGTPFRAIWVGTGGTVVLVSMLGTTLTFTNVPSGYLLPVAAQTVKSTANGTTATNLVGLY